MSDYKKLYALLCCAASKALDELPETPENIIGRFTLQTALSEAEEAVITDTTEEQ